MQAEQVVKVSTKGQIVIPKDVRKRFGITPGKKLLAEEIGTVLAYPRIATALEQAGIEPLAALSNILGLATLVKTRRPARVIEEDPADNRVLECALRAKAIFIVSGDKHVLKLGEFKGIRILSPREFLNETRGTRL